MGKSEFVYIIDVKQNGESAGRTLVENKISLGSGDDCDIVFPDLKDRLNPAHLSFKLNGQILSMYVTGTKSPTFLDDLELQPGKMFILENGDQIRLAGMDIVIRRTNRKEAAELVSAPPGENTIIRLIDADLSREFKVKPSIKKETPPIKRKPKKAVKKLELEDTGVFEVSPKISFIEKIKNAFAKKTKTPKKRENKKSSKKIKRPNLSKDQNYGLFRRLYALILHLSLFYFFMSYLAPNFKILTLMEPLTSLFQKPILAALKFIPPDLLKNPLINSLFNKLFAPSNINLFISFLGLEFIFHLILGSSLPQFIIGIADDRGPLIKRLIAVPRMILHYLLLPFAIFHLPILIRKRPIHEGITFTYLNNYGSPLKIIGPFIIAPVLIFLSFLGPLLLEDDFFIKRSFTKTNFKQKSNSSELKAFEGTIPFLNAQVKAPLLDSINFLPSFGKKNSQLIVIDTKSSQQIRFVALEKIKTNRIQEELEKNFSFIKMFFPNFFSADLNDMDNNQRKKEVAKIIEGSINLNFFTLLDSLKTFGPFFNGPYRLKNLIFQLLPKDNYSKISKINISKNKFFLLAGNLNYCFVPAQIDLLQIFCINSSVNAKSLYQRFINTFLKIEFKNTSSDLADPVFSFIDLKNIDNIDIPSIEKRFKEIGFLILDQEKSKLEKVYSSSLQSSIKYLQRNNIEASPLTKVYDDFKSANKDALKAYD